MFPTTLNSDYLIVILVLGGSFSYGQGWSQELVRGVADPLKQAYWSLSLSNPIPQAGSAPVHMCKLVA